MFGEKYPPIVRMVEMGGEWSRELCGGTHVRHSSQIGLINVLAEQSIGSGARRVEALVSTEAFNQLAAERALVHALTSTLRVQPDQLTERVDKLLSQLKDAEKQIAALKADQLRAGIADMVGRGHTVGQVLVIAEQVTGVGGNDLRTLATDLRSRVAEQAAVVALIGGTADKPALVVATTAGAREAGIKAGALVGVGAPVLGGKGGGKDDLAQGGGTDASQAAAALSAIVAAVAAGGQS